MSCATHCCKKHGCKYGHYHCRVFAGIIRQEFPCELCFDPNSYPQCGFIIGEYKGDPVILRGNLHEYWEIVNARWDWIMNEAGEWLHNPDRFRLKKQKMPWQYNSPEEALKFWWVLNNKDSEYAKKYS